MVENAFKITTISIFRCLAKKGSDTHEKKRNWSDTMKRKKAKMMDWRV